MRYAALIIAVACLTRDARAQVTVSGSPGQMTVSAATAGSAPLAVSNSNTTYSVTKPTGTNTYSITAQINTAMPAGVTLTITLAAAGGGSSSGAIALNTSAQYVETGIRTKVTGATITYQLSATAAAGVIAVQTRRVTLTAITVP
jgi:tartrate dehydratase alpha subunit/fumarate hydratase class I-like protein